MDAPPADFLAPGLPAFSWAEFFWTAEDRLPSWEGFQSRRGAYGARDSRLPARGRVKVSIKTPFDRLAQPHPSQIAAYRWLKEHEAGVARAVREAAFANYPGARAAWLRHYPDEAAALPVLTEPGDLASVMGLHDVHVLATAKAGFAYVGFEFGCNWDDEHGFGVMTHKDRVIAVGLAHTAIGPSAEVMADGGRDLDEQGAS